MQAAKWGCAGQTDKKVQEHLEKTAEQDLERHTGGGDEDDEMLAKLRAELHAEKNHVETAPAVEGNMKWALGAAAEASRLGSFISILMDSDKLARSKEG